MEDIFGPINGGSDIAAPITAESLECPNALATAAVEVGADVTLKTILTGVVVAAGLFKQYDALEKQGDLFEAQRDAGLRSIALAERTFNDTFIPAYKLAMNYFERGFRKQWEPILAKIVECGTKACEYVAEYERHTPRVMADVAKLVGGVKRTARRALDPYAVGICFEQSFKFAEVQSRMVMDAKNLGRAYEEDFKFKKDVFYWNRLTTSAGIAQNIGSLASNLMVQGKGSLINGLQTINQAVGDFDAAVGTGLSTLSAGANFYGGLGASVNGLFNQRDAVRDGQALLGASTSRGLPPPAQFVNLTFASGAAYQPMTVNYSIADMQTVNNSGLSTTNRGYGINVAEKN